MHEIAAAERTWFGTFTLAPQHHYAMQCRALAHQAARSIPIKELSDDDVVDLQSREVGKELTKFLKRLRKKAGSHSLRYLLVQERHTSGLPHYHALIHEVGDVPLTKRMLEAEWEFGFTKFKLVDESPDDTGNSLRAAYYVCKYLQKASDGRVRASQGYGQLGGGRHTASVESEPKGEA